MSTTQRLRNPVLRGRKSVFRIVFLGTLVTSVLSHGRLVDPPARGTMWRLGFDTPPDYNDHELSCGGFERQWGTNGGRCGECGDPWDMPRPRPHEAGGEFGTGTLGKVYRTGQILTAVVHLTANHNGWFEFRLCPTNSPQTYAKQGCLNKHVLKLFDYPGSRYEIEDQSQGLFHVRLQLPRGLSCSHCVLQWHYTSGNNWGFCKNGEDMMGCGKQEVFRGCADIAIFDQNDNTYYKFLNLTKDFDLKPIINLEDGMYLRNSDTTKKSNSNGGFDRNRDEENVTEERGENSLQGREDSQSSDDLAKLDDDGDGVINIDGNVLTLDALKSHLLASGLLISADASQTPGGSDNIQSSSLEYTSTTSRSRSKFRADRHKDDQRRGGNRKVSKKRTYVTPRTNVKESVDDLSHTPEVKNSVYVPSNTFRKSSFESPLQEISTKAPALPYATEASNTEGYTLGPVVVHRPLKPDSDRVSFVKLPPTVHDAAGSRGSQTFNDISNRARGSLAQNTDAQVSLVKPDVFEQTSASQRAPVKPFVPEPEDVLPELFSQLSSLKDYSRSVPSSSQRASAKSRVISTTDHTRLIEAVKTILTVSQVTTPSPDTQMQRIASQENKVSIPNIIVNPKSNEMVSFGFRRKPSSPDDHTFPPGIFSTITESVTRASRRSKPRTKSKTRARQSRPRTATPQTLLDAQATIQNLAAQTQLFSNQKLTPSKSNSLVTRIPKPSGPDSWEHKPSSSVTWKPKSRDIEKTSARPSVPKTSFSSIASQALFTQASDMSGAMAFQVPLSKLRDSATLDKLLEMKTSLLPESERHEHFDPILLIIM